MKTIHACVFVDRGCPFQCYSLVELAKHYSQHQRAWEKDESTEDLKGKKE